MNGSTPISFIPIHRLTDSSHFRQIKVREHGALLEQILTPSQFGRNVQTKEDSRELVEFVVRLPGPKDDPDACVWLPIDSKFPQEDYVRIQEAADACDAAATQQACWLARLLPRDRWSR